MKELLQSAKENAVFLLTCLAIGLGLVLLAKLYEHFVLKDQRKLRGARYISTIAMCAALAGILMSLEFPVFFAPEFYQLDLGEVPVLFCSFYLGPVAGIITEFLKVVIKLLVKGTSTAFVGDFANFAIGCSLIIPAAAIYHLRKTKRAAVVGMVTGTLIMAIFGSMFNAIYLLPKFSQLFGLPLDAIVDMGAAVNGSIHSVSTLALFAVAPLNLLKGIIASLITFLLYKRIGRHLFSNKS